MNNDEKGYVTPTPVDTNQSVNAGDTMLGRERDNIIVATNQVNNSINEEQIKETNNKIKYKKMPIMVKFLSIVITLLLIFFISFYVIKYSKKFIQAGEETTTTTTTVSALKKSEDYFNKDAVKKYETNNKILFILPKSVSTYVYEISYNESGIDNTSLGTYDDEYLYLTMDESASYKVSETGLNINNVDYKISSGEFKYYQSDNNILIINATPNALQGLYLSNGNVIEGAYMEYNDRIELKGQTQTYIFDKVGNTVVYNGVNLQLHV